MLVGSASMSRVKSPHICQTYGDHILFGSTCRSNMITTCILRAMYRIRTDLVDHTKTLYLLHGWIHG